MLVVDVVSDLRSGSHSLAWRRGDLYVMANAWWEPLDFRLHADGEWRVALSSSRDSGDLVDGSVHVAPRSTVVLQRVG